MSWLAYHRESERFASEAEIFAHRGDMLRAKQFYWRAAEAELFALDELSSEKRRTFGITAVSAIALHMKAAKWDDAQILAYRCLGSGRLPAFAWEQIEDLVDSIKLRIANVDDSAQLLVSARGGAVVRGGAPWDLVLPQMQRAVSLFHRTTEYIKRIPHRKRGLPSREIQDRFKPWIFQAEPGSYQFGISLQQSRQLHMFDDDLSAEMVVDRLYGILDVCATAPMEQISRVVPDDDYASTFLKLTRDMAPTDSGRFSSLEIRTPNKEIPIILNSAVRFNIRDALRERRMGISDVVEEEIRGVLRALHLNHDWIEVVTHETQEICRIGRAGEEVDDRIGPMVNQPVLVRVEHVGDKRNFVDIELDE